MILRSRAGAPGAWRPLLSPISCAPHSCIATTHEARARPPAPFTAGARPQAARPPAPHGARPAGRAQPRPLPPPGSSDPRLDTRPQRPLPQAAVPGPLPDAAHSEHPPHPSEDPQSGGLTSASPLATPTALLPGPEALCVWPPDAHWETPPGRAWVETPGSHGWGAASTVTPTPGVPPVTHLLWPVEQPPGLRCPGHDVPWRGVQCVPCWPTQRLVPGATARSVRPAPE